MHGSVIITGLSLLLQIIGLLFPIPPDVRELDIHAFSVSLCKD